MTSARMPTSASLTTSSHAPNMASGGGGTGWMSSAMLTHRMHAESAVRATLPRPISTATGSSMPSMPTCRGSHSSPNSSPVTHDATRQGTSSRTPSSPPAGWHLGTGATGMPTKTRSSPTSWMTSSTPLAKPLWALRLGAHAATTTSLIPSASATTPPSAGFSTQHTSSPSSPQKALAKSICASRLRQKPIKPCALSGIPSRDKSPRNATQPLRPRGLATVN